MSENNAPLDLPERPKNNKDRFFALRIAGTACLIIGLWFRTMHWPYSNNLLAAGLVAWTVWNVLFLLSGERKKFEIAYSVGRLSLAGALFLQIFMKSEIGLYLFGVAAASFLLGVVLAQRADD
jgi:hypothetical protein